MKLLARLWATANYVTSWLTLSPIGSPGLQQKPIPGKADIVLTNRPHHYPIFKPPTGRLDGPGSDFECHYPEMHGWSSCSTPEDRGCWLRHSDGREFNVWQDYEQRSPVGIVRSYTLVVEDAEINADGMINPDGKVIRQIYPVPKEDDASASRMITLEDKPSEASFPGPWLQACWGDVMNVTIINKMQYNGTSIHWHGIRQYLSMQMDGVNGVTQCPIAPNDTFTYTWNVNQYGSSWYHSHYSVQYADGVQGPITLHGPSSASYDEAKLPLLLTDWGHDSAFLSVDNEDPTNRTIVLNGRGNVTNFNDTLQNTTEIPEIYQLHFGKQDISVAGRPKRYLLRVINTSFQSTFIFSIDNHYLQMVGADFVPIEPYRNTSVLIGIGQRYHLIVEALPQGGSSNPVPKEPNFWIRTWVADGCGTQGTKHYERNGILRYDEKNSAEPKSLEWPDVAKACSDEEYTSLHPVFPWYVGTSANGIDGEQFDVTLNLSSETTFKPFPLAKFSLNRGDDAPTDFTPIRVNYSDPTLLNLDNFSGNWTDGWMIVPENYKDYEWIYLVITGTNGKTTYGAHPIHLHGHDFAILQQVADDEFSPEKLRLKHNNPPRRDVVLLPANGWIVIAFKADNPGSWLMHCHIAYHISYGLGLQVLERQAAANKLWPPDSPVILEATRVCDNWNNWYGDCHNWWPGYNSSDNPYPACEENTLTPQEYFQPDSGL